jgi:type VI secretion system ImpM family protein
MRRNAVTAFGGKVRVEPEFLSLAYGEPCLGFARWFDAGTAYALEHEGPTWRERFLRSNAQAFVYRAAPRADEVPSVLLGVLGPGEDRFARPYPFAVMTEIREPQGADVASLAVAGERFLASASAVCEEGRSARRASDIVARAQELVPPTREEHERAERDFADWQKQEGICASLWARLFTSGAAGAEICLRELVAARDARRSNGRPRAVRLPLGGGGAAATAFWIHVVRAVGRSLDGGFGAFWAVDEAAGTVLIELGALAPQSFAEIWSRDERDAQVLDLGIPDHHAVEALPAMDAAIADIVADPRSRVVTLLEALTSI